MKGNLYRRIQDGCIYEVIGQDEISGTSPCWFLWNERFAERVSVIDFHLTRQVGWELVGKVGKSDPQETTPREVPPALMK